MNKEVLILWLISVIVFIYSILLRKNSKHIKKLNKVNKLILKSNIFSRGLVWISLSYFTALSVIIFFKVSFKTIFILLSLLHLIVAIMLYLDKSLSDKDKYINIYGVFFMYSYILVFGLSAVQVVANNVNSPLIVLVGIGALIIIIFSSVWLSIIYLSKYKYKLIIVISCYIFIVAFGSWVFGIYYLYNNCWEKVIVDNFSEECSALKILWMLSKYSIGIFYNYPNEKVVCSVSILQYFIGKFIDLFLLGYIFNVIFQVSQKYNFNNEDMNASKCKNVRKKRKRQK